MTDCKPISGLLSKVRAVPNIPSNGIITFLRLSFFSFCLLAAPDSPAQDFRLSPPQTSATRILLDEDGRAAIKLDFRMDGALIRFTRDGTDPGPASDIYDTTLVVRQPGMVKARSYKKGFIPSDILTIEVLSFEQKPVRQIQTFPVAEKYTGTGPQTLTDGQLGDRNFHINWLGFEEREVEVKVVFNEMETLDRVAVGTMCQQDAWIFSPEAITVFDENSRPIGSYLHPDATEKSPSGLMIIPIDLPKKKYQELTIRIRAIPSIPDWHPGSGGTGWIFLDEIFFY